MEYLIVFTINGEIGNTGMSIDSPIKSVEDIRFIEAAIDKENKAIKKTIVTNWILLKP